MEDNQYIALRKTATVRRILSERPGRDRRLPFLRQRTLSRRQRFCDLSTGGTFDSCASIL